MLKRFVLVFGGALLLVASIGAIKYQQFSQDAERKASFVPAPAAVSTVLAEQVIWQPEVASVGSLSANEGIDLAAEYAGVVDGIHFKNGHRVTKGELLLSLNDEIEQADLIKFKAQAIFSANEFQRSKGLYAKKNISETAFDRAKSNLQVAKANVARTSAIIDKKNIKAPFDGVIGIRHFSLGQYIQQGQSLVTLQDISALRIDFAVPGKFLPYLYIGQTLTFRVSAYPERVFLGKVNAINAKVDETTRNISVQARAVNSDGLLRPGMYADIRLLMKDEFSAVTVPSTAISYSPFGDAVFVISENDQGQQVAKRVYIQVGEQRGDMVAVTQGLNAGDKVVNAGASKLENGSLVSLTNAVAL